MNLSIQDIPYQCELVYKYFLKLQYFITNEMN